MPDESDAKQILTTSPLENCRKPPGLTHITWIKTTQQDLEPLQERSNWRGSESSTLENDVYIWCYALIVVHARNEWMTLNLFHSNFGSVSIGPDCHVGVNMSSYLKLFGHEISFQGFQPMWPLYTNVTDRQTTCNHKTALCTTVHRTGKTEK